MICAASASSSLPCDAIDSSTADRRSSSSRRYRSRSSSVRSCVSSSIPVASLRYRAMNGTVAPPSSRSTAAETWFSRTPSSSAIRRVTGGRLGVANDSDDAGVTDTAVLLHEAARSAAPP